MNRIQRDDGWRPVKLRLLTSAIGTLIPLAILFGVVWGVLPIFGIEPSYGVNPRTEPVQTVVFLAASVALIFAAFTLGAVLAGWTAAQLFSRAEAESEFLWLMSFTGKSRLGRPLFRLFFSPDQEP